MSALKHDNLAKQEQLKKRQFKKVSKKEPDEFKYAACQADKDGKIDCIG
jgi:hypothetical protein